jgi:hypothetical protein
MPFQFGSRDFQVKPGIVFRDSNPVVFTLADGGLRTGPQNPKLLGMDALKALQSHFEVLAELISLFRFVPGFEHGQEPLFRRVLTLISPKHGKPLQRAPRIAGSPTIDEG